MKAVDMTWQPSGEPNKYRRADGATCERDPETGKIVDFDAGIRFEEHRAKKDGGTRRGVRR